MTKPSLLEALVRSIQHEILSFCAAPRHSNSSFIPCPVHFSGLSNESPNTPAPPGTDTLHVGVDPPPPGVRLVGPDQFASLCFADSTLFYHPKSRGRGYCVFRNSQIPGQGPLGLIGETPAVTCTADQFGNAASPIWIN